MLKGPLLLFLCSNTVGALSSCLSCILFTFQGQLAPGDGVPLYPCCSPDFNQRITRSPRARSCHFLAYSLAALQTDVCIRGGETNLALSHLVGPHRYARASLWRRKVRTPFTPSFVLSVPSYPHLIALSSLCTEQP